MQSPEAIIRQAHAFVLKKEYSRAIRLYRIALTENANNESFWSNLGAILYDFVENNFLHCGDMRIAAILGDSRIISDVTRNLWFELFDRSHCNGLKKCLEIAERCWRKAIEVDPGSFWARPFLIKLYENMAYFDKAQTEFEQAAMYAKSNDEMEWLKNEKKYFQEFKGRDADSILRPKIGTAAAPIHEMFGGELHRILYELDQLQLATGG